MFSQLLADFLFRLTFGIAVAMAGTSSKDVTSGFFRVHLWVLLGLQTLAAMAVFPNSLAVPEGERFAPYMQFWFAVAGAIASYFGAALWLYERNVAGKLALRLVSNLALAGSIAPILELFPSLEWYLDGLDRILSGRLMGFVITAMLLGHWYLNTPTMKLDPLKRLLFWLTIMVVLRMAVCIAGTAINLLAVDASVPNFWFVFLSLRWLSGLIGVLGLTWLTWQTLKIPNTQSATGILYAAVVLVFIGELTSLLLSAETRYPV